MEEIAVAEEVHLEAAVHREVGKLFLISHTEQKKESASGFFFVSIYFSERKASKASLTFPASGDSSLPVSTSGLTVETAFALSPL